MPSLEDVARGKLAELESERLRRGTVPTPRGPGAVVWRAGRRLLSFSSNDYLGLSQHPAVKQAAVAALLEHGTGAGASRLISGNHPLYADLEERLSAFGRYLKKNGLTVRKAAASDSDPYVSALQRYFGGETNALADLPVVLLGTAFQLKVWNALRAIPLGATSSYGELAASIGHPGAFRAVGTANGLNPAGIVVPCHRVIAADGNLAGFGGGIHNKRWLLEHEGAAFKQFLGRKGNEFRMSAKRRGDVTPNE